MPKTVEIKPGIDSPGLILNSNNNLFKIFGISFMENAIAFYEPVLEWFDDYIKSPNPETVLVIKLKYFNTSSAQAILNILERLREIYKNGKKNVLISWHYNVNDKEMEKAGKDYSELVDIPFEYISYEE